MNQNPFANMLSMIREEGSVYNPTCIELAKVIGIAPARLQLGGAVLTRGIVQLANVEIAAGDMVAITRIGEEYTIVLGKLMSIQ